MPPLTLTYCPNALRCLILGSGCGGVMAGMSGAKITPLQAVNGLNFNSFGARGARGRKARFCPEEGQGRAFCVYLSLASIG